MSWFNSIEILGKFILGGQILIVVTTIFTLWASVYKSKLEDSEKEIVSKELNASKKIIEKLEEKTTPRKLTEKQSLSLFQLLSFKSKYKVAGICRMMDKESYDYTEQLISVFQKAKWKIEKTQATFLDDIDSDIAVAISTDDQIEVANKLIGILQQVGLDARKLDHFRKGSCGAIKPNTIYIFIGTKK
jgi:hypothetical protein